jgi:hypothetical protein
MSIFFVAFQVVLAGCTGLSEVSLLYLKHRLPELGEVDVRGISAAYSPWETSEAVKVDGCPLLDTLTKGKVCLFIFL